MVLIYLAVIVLYFVLWSYEYPDLSGRINTEYGLSKTIDAIASTIDGMTKWGV